MERIVANQFFKIKQCPGDIPDVTENNNNISLGSNGSLSPKIQKNINLDTGNDVIHNQVVIGAKNPALQSIIPIEVVPSTSINNPLQNNTHVAGVLEPIFRWAAELSFAQRHPTLTKLFAVFVGILAVPVLFTVYSVASPFLMGAAFFSKACGSGELAKDIGASTIAKALWGWVANMIEEGDLDSSSMAMMAFIPFYAPMFMTSAATVTNYYGFTELMDITYENSRINAAINNCSQLNQNVQCWVNALPTDNANEIVLSKWEGWAKDPAQKNWTVPFSALLQKLWEGAPKNIIQKDKIDPTVAIRMVNLLIDIQKNPSPFIPLVSTLERSSLVTRGHRPLLSFLELELEVKAHTTRSGFEAGRKNRQDVLDVKLERRVYEVTYKNIRRELNKSGVEDKAEAALAVWARLYRTKALLVPGLLYHLRGSVSSETSYEVNTECEAKARNNWFVDIAKITDQVVSGVKQALLHG